MLDEDQKEALVELGRRLKNARIERNDTQKDFAFRIGVSIPTLQKMEKGSPQVAVGTWVKALSVLDRLSELEAVLAPEKSLAGRYAAFQKTRGRQRAGRRS